MGDAIFGCVVLIAAVGALCWFVWWSRRTIDMIHHKKLGSLRDIVQELKNGR